MKIQKPEAVAMAPICFSSIGTIPDAMCLRGPVENMAIVLKPPKHVLRHAPALAMTTDLGHSIIAIIVERMIDLVDVISGQIMGIGRAW